MKRPATTVVTLPFGATSPPYSKDNPHIGVDFSHDPDNKIYMPETGVVELRPDDGTCGNAIHIFVGNRHHALCHTSKYLVKNGQTVKEGTPIAIMGDSGKAIGVHLHWAVKVNDQFVDPLSLIKEQDMPTPGDVNRVIYLGLRRKATQPELDKFSKLDWGKLFDYVESVQNSHNLFPRAADAAQAIVDKIKSLVGAK